MKKRIIIWGIFLSVMFTISFLFTGFPWKTHASTKTEEKRILSLVKPSAVYADVAVSTKLYAQPDTGSTVVESLEAGSQVELLQDRTAKWYLVFDNITSSKGWLKGNTIEIPPEEPVEKSKMSPEDMTAYITLMNLKSNTEYIVWVDINRQLVNVFQNKEQQWQYVKSIICATGKNMSPTTRGTFQISEKGEWFYSERLGSGAKYWVRFNETYLFHSVAMDKNQTVIDGVLGEKRSGGCVRMSIEDAKWFYDTIPEKTTVFVN